jgi:ankyrin repeat protein
MSWTSSIKSRGSIASSLQQIWSNAEDETLVPGPTGTSESRQKIKSRLSEREQRIWEDLVDETQLAPPVAAEIPSYPEISLISRPCCPMLGKPKCPACGFSYSHRQAIIWATNLPTQFYTGDPMPYAHDKDHFQNTPLHFAAAKGSPDLLAMVKWLLLKRVDIEAINTSGETFMHVLNPALLSNTKEYISMLKLLAENKFPLSRRNYHSQSLANIYFAAYAPKDIPLEYLRLIGSYIKPDIYGLKCLNSEFDEKKYIAGYDTRDERQRRLNLDTLLTQCLESISRKESWTLRSMVGNLMKIPDLEKLVRDIENSGDSSLIHLIKNWPEKYEFYLRNVIHVISRLGAEVNLRDRNGDTALAIAAKRGLRFEVLLLLSCNANPNSRDYHGSGILSQATKCLLQARIDSRRYSRILSCIGLLTDNGAKVKPSVYDE